MNQFNEDFLALVRKNLPEATAAELKTFIENAEAQKKELEATKGLLVAQAPLLKEREALLSEKGKVHDMALAQLAKEKELSAKEQELQVSALKQQISALTEIKNNMFTVMQLFVKNPRSIEIMSTFGNDSYSGYMDNSGRYVNDQNVNVSRSTTTEKKEEKED